MIIYEKRFGAFNLLLRFYGSPWPRALLLALPSTLLAVLLSALAPAFVSTLFLHPSAYLAFGSIVTFVVIFRTNLSYSRYWEGSTMVRNMTSKWGDAVIQVITFDEAAEQSGVPGGLRFRSEFIHTMSLMHALAMQVPSLTYPLRHRWTRVISGSGSRGIFFLRGSHKHREKYWRACPLTVIGGLNLSEMGILEASRDRVYLVMCWLHRLLVARRLAGGIKEDAPIVSRIYQVLSDGMLGYQNAYKITTTPFPFPFAQSVALMLHLNAILAPLVLARWAGPVWLVGLTTFLTVFSAYVLNEVAREIEEPFAFDPNDLPVPLYQHKFNEHLLTAFLKSLFPHQAGSLFSQIVDDESLTELVARHRPTVTSKLGPETLGEPRRRSYSGSHETAHLHKQTVSGTP